MAASADQISVIDTDFFDNFKFRNDIPVFSGHELFTSNKSISAFNVFKIT